MDLLGEYYDVDFYTTGDITEYSFWIRRETLSRLSIRLPEGLNKLSVETDIFLVFYRHLISLSNTRMVP